jgi:hypothetical protein
MTPSPSEPTGAGRAPPALVALPEGALLLDHRPVWRLGSILRLALASLLVLAAVGIFTLVAGSSGSMLALLGLLWLSPWLALTAGNGLIREARIGREVLRQGLGRRAARRRLRRAPVVAGSLATAAGGWIRVRGRVLDGPGFVSASGRARCVLACYAGLVGGRDNPQGRAEVHAVPSCRLLVGDVVVEVALDRARYLEHFLPAAPRRHEETIAAGDEVEVLGDLTRTLDPGGGGYRTPALKLVLGGDDRRPVVLRR